MVIELNDHDKLNRQLKTRAEVKTHSVPPVVKVYNTMYYLGSDGVDHQGFQDRPPQYYRAGSIPKAKVIGEPQPHGW